MLRVIAMDGHDVEPEAVQSVVIASGERYDVLVQTKMNSRKNFFIRAESMELKSRYQVYFFLFYTISNKCNEFINKGFLSCKEYNSKCN